MQVRTHRAALLAAINDAAATMRGSKQGGGPKSTTSAALMQSSRVNANVARDLVSHAGSSKVGDMADFAAAERFEHEKNLLNNASRRQEGVEEDLRSLRSEYDYGSKKKFLDVLGNVSTQAKLNKLRAEHEMNAAGGVMSHKGSQKTNSHLSYQSKLSKLSQRSKLSKHS